MQQRFLFCLQVTLTLALLLAVALARPQFGGFQQPGFGFQQPGFGGFPIGKNRTLLLWVFVNLYMTSLVFSCHYFKQVVEVVLELELVMLGQEEFLHQE